LQPYVLELAKGLLITTVFDREINCRRAASAAFQEHVGRQGIFSHGIEILTAADYFTVGNRMHAYTEIAAFVAQFEEYRESLISHLITAKVRHWDKAIREATAEAFSKLAPLDPLHMRDRVLPTLLGHARAADMNTKHGSMLAIGSVLRALSRQSPPVEIGTILLEEIDALIPTLTKARVFAQFGSDNVREGACILIRDLSLAKIPLREATIKVLQAHIDEHINRKELELRDSAIAALRPFVYEYYVMRGSSVSTPDLISLYMTDMQTGEMNTKRGCPLAIGTLPYAFYGTNLLGAIQVLREGMEKYVRLSCSFYLSRMLAYNKTLFFRKEEMPRRGKTAPRGCFTSASQFLRPKGKTLRTCFRVIRLRASMDRF